MYYRFTITANAKTGEATGFYMYLGLLLLLLHDFLPFLACL
jgi:hypothetical protein